MIEIPRQTWLSKSFDPILLCFLIHLDVEVSVLQQRLLGKGMMSLSSAGQAADMRCLFLSGLQLHDNPELYLCLACWSRNPMLKISLRPNIRSTICQYHRVVGLTDFNPSDLLQNVNNFDSGQSV